MTQNVDLQVKVKFIVDPKDLQAALSGGGSGGPGGGSVGRSGATKGAQSPPHAGEAGASGLAIPRLKLAPGYTQSMRDLSRALEIQGVRALNFGTNISKLRLPPGFLDQVKGLNKILVEQGKIDATAEEKRVKAGKQRLDDLIKIEALTDRMATKKKRIADSEAQAAAQSLRKSQLSGRKAGKGYGSEGMFAAGTSPIMQGLAWQSLFATGDILGPMSFAPMALYQNYSLKRQRRNRGFDLGAGSDLAKAAGVGDTGQIATAGHALAAIRRNQALSPEEREKRMAQVDIMSAGRVRGRLGRGIEMFEAGQVGGGAVRALGGVVGAIGGVASVATGAVAGVGALVMALNHLDDRMKDSVNNIRAITDSMEEARRTQRRSEQMEFEGGMAGSQGTDLSVLERAGLSGKFTPQMRSGLAKIGRAAGPEKMKALVGPMLQAARMFDLQPEDVLGEVLQSGAYRQPTERMLARMPLILANSVNAIPARRREMRAMWAKRTPEWTSSGTAFGDMAEISRSAAAYAEGAKLDRGMGWDATRKAEIKRLEEEAAKLPLGDAVGRETLNMKIKSIAQPEGTLTRSLANDPLFLQKQDMYSRNSLALEKLTEQLQKSSPITKGLSAVAGEVTGGLWETQSAKRDRTLYEQKFAEWVVQQMRQMGAGDRQ
jgi:hypothetical protein